MPRLAITPRQLVKNGNLDATTGTVSLATLVAAPGGIINNARPEQLFLRVANTEGTTNTITVKAGVAPPSLRGGQGDLVITIAATTGVQYIGPFESDKYLQADGSLIFDFEAAMTGTLDALYWPRDI